MISLEPVNNPLAVFFFIGDLSWFSNYQPKAINNFARRKITVLAYARIEAL